jgi:FixJ family two-component response regulator
MSSLETQSDGANASLPPVLSSSFATLSANLTAKRIFLAFPNAHHAISIRCRCKTNMAQLRRPLRGESALFHPMVSTMTDGNAIVAIIDSDPCVRDALQEVLETNGVEVQAFGSTEDFFQTCRSHLPSCIVLYPGERGIDALRELLSSESSIPIVLVAADGDIRMCLRAVKAGAMEYLVKPFRCQDLLGAVREGIECNRLRRAEDAALSALRARFELLTVREQEILALLSAGRQVKEIAGQLRISTHTARVHRTRVLSKIGARSIADLVRMSDKLAQA